MLRISLDGVDITGRCLPSADVTIRENAAARAVVVWRPLSGAVIRPHDLKGKTLTIEEDITGQFERLFTGFVNAIRFNEQTITIEGLDGLQTRYDAMTETEILAEISGARYSADIFGERESGWQQARDALTTVRSSVFLDRNGTLQLVDWHPSQTPDYAFVASPDLVDGVGPFGEPYRGNVLYQSIAVQMADHSTYVNHVAGKYVHRYTRRCQRRGSSSWQIGPTGGPAYANWCEWAAAPTDLPLASWFESGTNGSGWNVDGDIGFAGHPQSGTYCGGTVNFVLNDEDGDRTSAVWRAQWTWSRNYSVTVEEAYTIDVQALASIAVIGSRRAEQSSSAQDPYNDAGVDADRNAAIPPGFQLGELGDYIKDELDDARRQNNLLLEQQRAMHRIASTHRQSYIRFATRLHPHIDPRHMVDLDTAHRDAFGKVRQVRHRVDGANRTTEVEIALFDFAGGTTSPVTVPDRPDTAPTHQPTPASIAVDNYLGGLPESPPWQEPASGSYYAGNYAAIQASAQGGEPQQELNVYPWQLRISGPEIEQEARDTRTGEELVVLTLEIPDTPYELRF